MNAVRAITLTVSLLAHATFAVGLTQYAPDTPVVSFDKGEGGNDFITVEQGVALEGLAKLGDAMETIETAELTPVTPDVPPPPPVQEVKQVDELSDTITSQASQVEDNIVKTEEPPPPQVQEKQVEEVQPQEQPKQVAIVSEQSSGAAKKAADPTARTEYLGKLRDVLEHAKVNPRSRAAGTVVVKFKIGTDGQLMSREITASSGSKILDDAAIAALERAAPFPSMPALF